MFLFLRAGVYHEKMLVNSAKQFHGIAWYNLSSKAIETVVPGEHCFVLNEMKKITSDSHL